MVHPEKKTEESPDSDVNVESLGEKGPEPPVSHMLQFGRLFVFYFLLFPGDNVTCTNFGGPREFIDMSLFRRHCARIKHTWHNK